MSLSRYYMYYSINGVIYHFYDYVLIGNEIKRKPFSNREVKLNISKWELFKYRLKYKWWKIAGHTWATHSFNARKYNDDIRRVLENEIK